MAENGNVIWGRDDSVQVYSHIQAHKGAATRRARRLATQSSFTFQTRLHRRVSFLDCHPLFAFPIARPHIPISNGLTIDRSRSGGSRPCAGTLALPLATPAAAASFNKPVVSNAERFMPVFCSTAFSSLLALSTYKVKPSRRRVYAMIDNLDSNIGRILNALEKADIAKNTIVVFLSDNGPAFPGGISRYNAGMKGWKGSVDEGGTRVPFIAYWPGRIEGGNRLDIAAQHIDLFPTLMALIGARAAKRLRLDGRSLAKVLRGGSPNPTLLNRLLFTHHFRNTQKPSEVAIKRGPGAVRAGDFLATMDATEKWSLYNVKRDPSQLVDLATQDSIRLNRLVQEYDRWFKDVSRNAGARIPIEVGIQGHPKVLLQAHEASLFGEGIKYQSGAGWANDWISDWTSSIGFAQWQLRVVRSGYYRVTLSYSASPLQAGARVAAEFGGTSVEHRLPATPPSKDDWGRRLFFTDEAPERQWHEIMLGDVYLKKGLLSLNLRAQDITHDGAGDIKSIRIDHIKS